MRKTLVLFAGVFGVFAASGARADVDPTVKSGLLNIKEALLNNDVKAALSLVDGLLAYTPVPEFKIFTKGSITFYTTYGIQLSYPSCTFEDMDRVKRKAQELALADCNNANYQSCQVTSDVITKSGELDASDVNKTPSIDVTYSGCIATATVKGFK